MSNGDVVVVKRTALEEALERLERIEDRGPAGETWQSEELCDLIAEIKKALAVTPWWSAL